MRIMNKTAREFLKPLKSLRGIQGHGAGFRKGGGEPHLLR